MFDAASSRRDTGRACRLNQFLAAPRHAVWTMAAPMMAGMAVHTLYIIADTAFIGTLIGIAAFLGSSAILGIFTADAEAIAIGHTYLGFMVFAYPMMAFGMTSGRLLQGTGHGLPSLVITSFRVLIVGIPLAYMAVLLFGAPIEAVWASLLTGGLCSTVLSAWWVRRLVWLGDPTVRATDRKRDPAQATMVV